MLKSLSNTQKGILAAFAGFTGFAFADACSKWLGAHYESINIIFWVYYLAMFFGLALSPFLGGFKQTLKTTKLHLHILRGACAMAVGILIVTALSQGMQLATMYTILFLAPFLTTIAAMPIFKERVPPRDWIIIAIGFSGIIVAFHDGLTTITPEIIYVLQALVFIVFLGLLARPLGNETIISLSLFPSITIAVLMSVMFWGDIELPQMIHWPIFIFNSFCVMLGLSGIAYGYRIAPYSIVAPVHYSQMVIALILGYCIFGDLPDIWMLVGAGIIIASGIMMVRNKE